jgi:hypothetical protein
LLNCRAADWNAYEGSGEPHEPTKEERAAKNKAIDDASKARRAAGAKMMAEEAAKKAAEEAKK